MLRAVVVVAVSASISIQAADAPRLPEPSGTISFRENGEIGRVLQDSSGDLWLVENDGGLTSGLRQLTEKGWTQTPVKQLPHPNWTARPAPPWNGKTGPVVVISGKNGSLLAVVLRDIYQDMVKDLPKDHDHWNISKLEGEKYNGATEKVWLEGWLRKQGKWMGPTRIEKLLKDEYDTIRKDFQDSRSLPMHFDLVSDGQTIWTIFNGQLTAYDGEKTLTRQMPRDEKWRHYLLGAYKFFRHPDGLWCYTRVNDTFDIAQVSLKEGRIVATQLPGLTYKGRVHPVWQLPRFHVTSDKQVIATIFESGPTTMHPYFFKDGAWKRHDDLGQFWLEDADGNLWFQREDRWKETTGYDVIRGNNAETFPMPNTWTESLNSAGDKRRFSKFQFSGKKGIVHRIAELSATGKTGAAGWKVEAVYSIDSSPHMPTQLFADRWGNLVSEYGAVGTIRRDK